MRCTINRKVLVIFFIQVFIFFSLIAFGVQAKKHEALLGIWDVQTESGSYRFEFKFILQDGDLVGFFIGNSGEAIMEDLFFEDNKLKFYVIIIATGQGMILDFEATINGNNLEGIISLEYGDANIIGKKREKMKRDQMDPLNPCDLSNWTKS
jgi:hypothetical protein